MILNKSDKQKLRNEIKKTLDNVDTKNLIYFDKEFLDFLLFDYKIVNNTLVKLPVWTGKFLSKIDLSNVSFSDVAWDMLDDEKIIDYSYTNANIDLSLSYNAKENNSINLKNCIFQNTNVYLDEDNNIKEIIVNNSNLKNTNIVIPKNVKLKANYSNFCNTNLENVTISLGADLEDSSLYKCYFKNTKLNIILDNSYYKDLVLNAPPIYINDYAERIKYKVHNEWVNCYLNGKLIKTKEEKELIKSSLLKQYEAMKKELFNATVNNINKQLIRERKFY